MTETSRRASARVKRTPVGSRNRISLKHQDPDYTYRIVNDLDDRVQQLLDAGYEIDTTQTVGDKRVDTPSAMGGAFSVGNGVKAFVMRQKKEWYQEDQASKQAQIDQVEQTMYSDARKAADYGSVSINVEK